MFRNLNKTYLALCVLLIGTCSWTFGIDFSQALTQANERSLSLSSIFHGKSFVSNLYSKALQSVKDREVIATNVSFKGMKAYYTNCPGVKESDFINVLYNYNTSFQITFKQLFPKGVKYPTTDDIKKSYQKFLVCNTDITWSATQLQIDAVNNKIESLYMELYTNHYSLSTIDTANFWSDLFRNGTLDDSDFDLLVDINAIGKLLFEEFKETPEILFYRLPEINQSSTQAWADLSTLDDQTSYMVGGGGGASIIWWAASLSSSSSWWTGRVASLWNASSLSDRTNTPNTIPSSSLTRQVDSSALIEDDKEINDLVQSTFPTSSPLVGAALVLWNQCLSWETAQTVVLSWEEINYQDPATYIKDINTFITTANTDDVVLDALVASFHASNPLPSWGSTSDSGYASYISNLYAEQIFWDPQPGSCEYGCQGLSVKEQAQCEVSCVSSCIQQCDEVSGIQNKAICVSDCTCALIAWPNGLWREKMEDMFRIKFCKVPVQSKTVSKGKKVFSIQAIFQEISDVLQWLRDSGQMIKFSKTKEFLDGTIKIKLADNFAFKILVGFKPVFAQRSATITTKEQEKELTDLNVWILDMNTTNPTADNYNKYIVIADPVRTAASAEFADTIDDIQQNIASFQAVQTAAEKLKVPENTISSLSRTQQNLLYVDFINTTISFLKENQSFWENMRQTLRDMSITSAVLTEQIKASK